MLKKTFINKQSTVHFLENVASKKGLLFLHGFPDTPQAWHHQFHFFKDQYTILAPYAPGIEGTNTDKKKNHSPKIDEIARNYLALLKNYQLSEVTIIAHDLGGPVAVKIAQFIEDSPDSVKLNKVILINAPSLEQMYFRKNNLNQLKKSWYIFIFQIPTLPLFLIKKNWNRLQQQTLKQNNIDFKENYNDPKVLNSISLYRSFFKEIPSIIKNLKDKTLPPKVRIPIHFIWSRKDPYLDVPSKAELEMHYAHFSIDIVEAFHWPQLEIASQINQLIKKQLENDQLQMNQFQKIQKIEKKL